MPTKDTYLNISTATLIKFFAILGGLTLIYMIREILMSLLFAIIVASSIEPAVEWLKKRRVPRILSVIIIFLSIGALLFFVVYLIFPLVFEEFIQMSQSFPKFAERVLSGIEQFETLPFSTFISDNIQDFFRLPSEYIYRFSGGVFDFATSIFGGLFSFVLIVVFAFYLAAQENGIESFLRLVSPLEHEPYILDLWKRSQRKLGRWLRSQMLLGAIVGVLIFFGLTFMGVEHAFLFAVLAASFEIIPVVGPILAAVPAVFLAFLVSPFMGFGTVILYTVVQQVESHVIVPVVMRKMVGLSPLVVVLALLVGAKVGGLFGILLAVPITSIIAEFINDWDKKKRALMPG